MTTYNSERPKEIPLAVAFIDFVYFVFAVCIVFIYPGGAAGQAAKGDLNLAPHSTSGLSLVSKQSRTFHMCGSSAHLLCILEQWHILASKASF